MIEAGANEVPEATVLEAIYKAHDVNQTIIAFINQIVAEVGKKKHEYVSCAVPQEMFDEMKKIVTPEEMEEAVFTDEKQVREENIRQVTAKFEEAFADREDWLAILPDAVYQYQKKTVRKMILKDHKRPDGRAIDEIRPLSAEIDILPRVHGSGMFKRGQTQIMTVTTLAPLSEVQKVDGIALSCVQFAVMMVLSTVCAFTFETVDFAALGECTFYILYIGILSSAGGYTLQILAQKDGDPTVVSLLLSLESFFAVVCGAIILHERMSGREYLGCALMLTAVLLSQLPEKTADAAEPQKK